MWSKGEPIMPGAYSADLRERVLRVCECGTAEPGQDRGAVPGGRDHALSLAAGVAGRGTLPSQAACRWPSPTAGCDSVGQAQGPGSREQRSDPGRVRSQAGRAGQGAGERLDRVPGAAEAGTATQKRPCARKSRTGQISSRLGQVGVPSWPRSIRSTWSFWTRVGSIPA